VGNEVWRDKLDKLHAGIFGKTGAISNRPENHSENRPVWLGVI
jgi:hypothetical protein